MRSLQEIVAVNNKVQASAFAARFKRAIELLPDGFTIDKYGKVVHRVDGFAVAVRSVANLADLEKDLREKGVDGIDYFYGYWRDETGKEYFEVSRIYDSLGTALSVAQECKQKAIYDFENKRDIELRVFGL